MLYNLFENRDFVSVFAVALLAEGVDRNFVEDGLLSDVCQSPSSRRAWIEIKAHIDFDNIPVVALLAEGVDRNKVLSDNPSLVNSVALLAEGVDRNTS